MGPDPVEIVMTLEDAFDIAIPDVEAERMETIGDIVRCIARRLAERQRLVPGHAADEGAFFHQVRAIVARSIGMRVDEIGWERPFRKDPGFG